MWLSNVYLKTLRDYRVAIFGWGIGMGLLMLAVISAVPSLLNTAEARAALISLGASFSWMAEPVKLDTPGGYATWKYGPTVLVMAIWPIVAAARMMRGDEERGLLDSLLSLPLSRGRVALQKLAALWTALLAMGLLVGLLTYAGSLSVSADFGLADSLLFGLNLSLACGVFGSLAMLVAQFVQEQRAASGIAGGLLLVSIMLDMLHRVFPGSEWLSRLSPVYYYSLSKPLVPSYGTDPVALVVLAALCVIFSASAIWLFVRRDIGRTVALPRWIQRPERSVRPQRALPVNDWSLRSVYRRSLATIASSTAWWTLAIAGFAAFMIFVAKQTMEQLQELMSGSPLLQDVINNVGGGSQANFSAALLSFLYVFLPVMLMAFAVTQASRWAGDEEDGLHDLLLSVPQPRLTVILSRFGALATATVVIAVVTLVASAATAAASGLALDGNNLAAASLSMIPLGLLTAALGYLFSGWLRAAIDTGLLSFLLVIWFAITFIGPELGWSEGVLRLSALYYYGQPLVNGWQAANMLGVLLVAGVALALASARYMRKDIGR
ncbi:MAG TPA: ABC transporter permease subunit [Chloroflexia bacterium]|nr:ABC transporter permease subunit [Chloroflexia bacterium]